MKHNLLYTLLMATILLGNKTASSQSSVTIGTGSGSATSAPIASWYNSSATESIYLGSEIGSTGYITKIAYNKASGSSLTNPHIQIFLKTTAATNIGTTAYILGTGGFSTYTLVYEGTLPNSSTSGWMEVNLTTPFLFSSTGDNLSVLVVGSTCISSGRPQYRYTTTTSRMSSTYDDGSIACGGSTIWDPGMTFTPKWERPNIRLTLGIATTSCVAPSDLISSAVSHNTATISWIAASGAISYEYHYSTANTAPAEGFTGTPVTGISTSLSGLTAGTTYYIWARSVCSTTEKSNWLAGTSFTTLCDTAVLPLEQAFNSSPERPACWTEFFVPTGGFGIVDAATHIQYVTAASSPTASAIEGTGMVKFNAYSINSGTQKRLQSPAISTIDIASVDISFQWYHSTLSPSLNDRMQIQYSLDGTSWIDAGSVITRYGGSNAWSLKTITLPAAAGEQENIYVGFLFLSENGYNMYLDDVKITASNSCTTPSGLSSGSISHNTATIFWAPVSDVTGYEYYYNTSNVPPATSFTGTPITTTSILLEGLTEGTTYYVWTRSVCSGSSKSTWSSAYTFTTSAALTCNPPSTISTSAIGTTSAYLSWTAHTSAIEYEACHSTSSTPPSASTTGTTTSSTSMELPSLIPSTTYYVWVRSKCSTDLYSNWSIATTFTTLTPCIAPTDISTGYIDITNADITWTASSSASMYEYYYSNSAVAPTTSTIGTSTTSTSITLASLSESTTYHIWVRSICGASQKSEWIGPATFTTLCNMPRVDSFEIVKINDYIYQFLPKGAIYTDNYIWNFGDESTSSITNPTHTFAGNGDYNISLCVTNTCVDECLSENSFTKNIHISSSTSISHQDTDKHLKIYPNPVQHTLNIESSSIKVNNATIYNILGEKISTHIEHTSPISIQHLAAGFYILKVETNSGLFYHTFQKINP